MNRKAMRDQKNDISIIIGNLPKRLQKKIAAETGVRCFADIHEQDAGIVESQDRWRAQEAERIEQSPQIDLFLRMGASEASIGKEEVQDVEIQVKAKTATLPQNRRDTDVVSIPGILRLNTQDVNSSVDVECLATSRNEAACVNGKKPRAKSSTSTVQQCSMRANPSWFKLLLHKDSSQVLDLPQLHDDLLDMMQKQLVLENWIDFCECHSKLQKIFQELLLNQLKFCCEQKIETYFWKLLFYNVIEYLKHVDSTKAGTLTIMIIDNGLEFYEDLLQQLIEKYEIAKGILHHHHNYHQQQHNKFEFIAKVSAQKLLICLGDLSRYKSKLSHLNDFTNASDFYQRAQKLIPTNGIPYNQLAVLAIYNRKKFDAIYFHMRSLMSSNAICSARESLQVLFDEIRKKYEESEVKNSPIHLSKVNSTDKLSNALRKEVWIHPDGVRRLHRTDIQGNSTSSEESRLNELTSEELLRKFTSLYLYTIGKLFTGIGMETIKEHQRKLFIQLTVILRQNPLMISAHRLLKIVALNIFIMEHNKEKATRCEIRYHAFVFCNQMFGFLLRKCNDMLTAYVNSMYKDQNSFQDLNTLLQFVKIWCDWLLKNSHIWEPLRSEENFLLDPWIELDHIFNNIDDYLNLNSINPDDYASAVLEEDIYLIGFTPTSTAGSISAQGNGKLGKNDQFNARLANISNFNMLYRKHKHRLENKKEPNFYLEDLNAQMKNVLASVKIECEEEDNSENIVENGHDMNVGILKETNDRNLVEENAQMSQLSKLKKELEAKSNFKKMYTAKLEEILKFVDTKLYIEVRPKYLLPDTNCFIDCLEDFAKLVREYNRYILIIPLTVVKELDGLSKGVKLESYEKSLQKNRIHHFDDVSTRAKKSLDFIKTTNHNIKCATTKGSIINASLFSLVEEEHVSNDDKILATALALSKSMSTETSKGGKCFIQTELVLITTDRNLRVKALSRNLAVSELSEFQQWANGCN